MLGAREGNWCLGTVAAFLTCPIEDMGYCGCSSVGNVLLSIICSFLQLLSTQACLVNCINALLHAAGSELWWFSCLAVLLLW